MARAICSRRQRGLAAPSSQKVEPPEYSPSPAAARAEKTSRQSRSSVSRRCVAPRPAGRVAGNDLSFVVVQRRDPSATERLVLWRRQPPAAAWQRELVRGGSKTRSVGDGASFARTINTPYYLVGPLGAQWHRSGEGGHPDATPSSLTISVYYLVEPLRALDVERARERAEAEVEPAAAHAEDPPVLVQADRSD